jgi:hypothetical protein
VAAAAGVVVEHEQREPDSQAVTGRVTYYLDAGRLRIESQTEDGDETTIIFRADKPVAWTIDQVEKTYFELTPAEVERLRQQMEQGRRQMEEALKQMPPEQREAMEQMMGQMGTMMAAPEPAVVRVVAEGESVSSFVCTHYEVARGGQRESEVWAAPIEDLKLRPAEYQALIDLARLFEPLSQAMPVGQLGELAALDDSDEAIEGFPVRTLTYVESRPVSEEIVTRAEREDFSAELFELPRGLRKREFGEEF